MPVTRTESYWACFHNDVMLPDSLDVNQKICKRDMVLKSSKYKDWWAMEQAGYSVIKVSVSYVRKRGRTS